MPASEKEPEGWSAADKFTVVSASAGLNPIEVSAYAGSWASSRSRCSAGARQPKMPPKSQC